MKRVLFMFLTLVSALAAASGVTVSAAAPKKGLAGKPVTVKLLLSVSSGYHIYPSKSAEGIPTEVKLVGPAGFKISSVKYPKTSTFQGLDGPIPVYSGNIAIEVMVATPKAAKGAQTLVFSVKIQACNDRTCLVPSVDTAKVTLKF